MDDIDSLLARPALEVAPALLGYRLRHRTSEGVVTVELSEVEAYAGEADPASHAGRGRTPRNAVMYGAAGHLYVYFSYGMHWCANIVCGPEGTASAVLLRAGGVVEGVDLARARRPPRTPEAALARGPACLTQALGIGREHDGADLLAGTGPALLPGPTTDPAWGLNPAEAGRPDRRISRGPRVGVSQAADAPWRFWLDGDPSVSAYKRSPRAPAPAAAATCPKLIES